MAEVQVVVFPYGRCDYLGSACEAEVEPQKPQF